MTKVKRPSLLGWNINKSKNLKLKTEYYMGIKIWKRFVMSETCEKEAVQNYMLKVYFLFFFRPLSTIRTKGLDMCRESYKESTRVSSWKLIIFILSCSTYHRPIIRRPWYVVKYIYHFDFFLSLSFLSRCNQPWWFDRTTKYFKFQDKSKMVDSLLMMISVDWWLMILCEDPIQ